MKKLVKIQNVLLWNDIEPNLRRNKSLMFKNGNMIYDLEKNYHILRRYDTVQFNTYFGALQIGMLKEKTTAEHFFLYMEISGKCSVEVQEYYRSSKSDNFDILFSKSFFCKERTPIQIDLSEASQPIVSFSLTALEDLYIYNCSYMAEVDEENLREVNISLVSTTFKKENFVLRNIQTLKNSILSDNEVKNHFFVNIIDNGKTLDVESIDGFHLKVFPNKNVGGAGGFTRGMIESLRMPQKPDYVLLMDDDVLIMSESLYRTYYLLRILKPEYYGHFVSGAMFDYDKRYLLYEDIGYVHRSSAGYGPLKDKLNMKSLSCLLNNELMTTRQQDYSYAGWWYCCIPINAIEKNGLPLPLFVRGDDVEFSIRNQAKFITMNGICIWHVGFSGKFNAAMELYQVHRNSLIIQAVSNIFPDIDFVVRINSLFWKELTRFAYSNAEQLLEAIDDFMKGPDFIRSLDGEKSLREHNAMNEKMLPFSEFPEKYDLINQDAHQHTPIKSWEKFLYICTINGHLLPNFFLNRKPQYISYDWFFSARSNYMRRSLIAINENDKTAHLRVIDRKRCMQLIGHYLKTMKNYRKNCKFVKKMYREAYREFTSQKFWVNYLDI